MIEKITSCFLALAVAGLMSMSVIAADDTEHPQALVEKASAQMQMALAENKDTIDADTKTVYPLIEQYLLPIFDFSKIAQLALGKNWRKASPEQKVAFTREFQALLVRSYSTAMLEYASDEIRYLPFKGDLDKRKVTVETEVLRSGGASAVPMSLNLYQNKAGDWKVYNIKIDGISLVTNYRSSFNDAVRKNGLDTLISDIAARNMKALK